jgi:hypothetical protein
MGIVIVVVQLGWQSMMTEWKYSVVWFLVTPEKE